MRGIPITGVGAVTSVGLSAPATCAALRAGIARLTPLQLDDSHGTVGDSPPPVGGRAPLEWFNGGPVEEEWPGHERFGAPLPEPEYLNIEEGVDRLIRLALPAAVEAWNRAGWREAPPSDWGLYVAMGEEEDVRELGRITTSLCTALGGFNPREMELLPYGRAAGLGALFRAYQAMARGEVSGAIVVGVDSLVRLSARQRLAQKGTLKDPESNPQGIIPGEAAAVMVLERAPRGAVPMAFLATVAAAEEPTSGTEEPNWGEGLTTVLRNLHSAVSLSHVPLVICDLNGDRYRAMEWGLAATRVLGSLPHPPDVPEGGEIWHPADCTGDTGAASGVMNCVWAVDALRKGYGGGEQVLVWGASDGSLRCGAILVAQS